MARQPRLAGEASAAMKELKRIALETADTAIKLAFDRVYEWAEQFKRIHWLSGVVVGPFVTVGAGNVTLDHKLGRVPQGFIVIGNEGAASDSVPSIVSKNDRQMTLNFSGSSTMTLWVWG